MMSSLSSVVKRHPLITFFILTYALAREFVPFGPFGAFGPLIAALIVTPITQGLSGLRGLGLPPVGGEDGSSLSRLLIPEVA